MAQQCIPPPVGGNPIVWHMDAGDRLQLKNLKYGANQQVYVTCGPQIPEACGAHSVVMGLVDGKVTMKGSLCLGARMAMPHQKNRNTIYKNIDLVCKVKC